MPVRRNHPDLTSEIDDRCGVIPFTVLSEAGVSRGRQRAMVAGGRWRAVPGKGVIAAPSPTDGEAALREALLMIGPSARLGGVTALMRDGLTGYTESQSHIWVPKGHEKVVIEGVRLHETRRWSSKDCALAGLPRSTPPVATVQGALWSVTARQAMLCLVMPIQQRMVRVDDVELQLDRVRRHRFRKALRAGLRDIRLGAESLNEIDFAIMCRARGSRSPPGKWCVTCRRAKQFWTRCGRTMAWSSRSTALVTMPSMSRCAMRCESRTFRLRAMR